MDGLNLNYLFNLTSESSQNNVSCTQQLFSDPTVVESPRAHLHVVGTSLPTPFYSVLVSISVFMALSTVLFHKFSRQLSAFSLCSSCLNSVLLVLSAVYLLMKVFLSPSPKGGRGCLMSPPCLESQGCHLIPLCYLLSCSSA